MNKISFFILVIIIGTVICCKQKPIVKSEYFQSGEIKSISYFHSSTDQFPYEKISYYTDGNIQDSCYYDKDGKLNGRIYSYNDKENYKKWSYYLDGFRNGKSIVVFNNGRKIIQFFRNDTLNGVEYRYNDNKLTREVLWVDDKPVVMKDISYPQIGDTLFNFVNKGGVYTKEMEIIEDTIQVNSYFIIEDNQRSLMGSLRFGKDSQIIKNYNNSYVTINLRDTIFQGESLPVTIKGYFGNFKDAYMECVIDNLSDKSGYEEQLPHYTTSKGDYEIKFNHDKYDLGYNTLIGRIYLKRDSAILHEVIFYKDFYVEKNEIQTSGSR